jgi:NADH dehydrogenase (ubiquinone) Fe-S protein 4
MGWTSSADPVQALNVKFLTKDDAVLFADKQGWDYWIEWGQLLEEGLSSMYSA